MTRLFHRILALLSVTFVSLGCSAPPRGQWVWDVGEQGPRRPSPQLLQQLQTKADFNVDGEPLLQVFEKWHESFNVNFHPNWAALEAAAIDPELQVFMALRNVSLTAALECLLNDVGGGETELAYITENNALLVSTKEDLARRTTVRVYDVCDFIDEQITAVIIEETIAPNPTSAPIFDERKPTQWAQREREFEGMAGVMEIITQMVEPYSWVHTGGTEGTICSLGSRLVIKQTQWAHHEIEALLTSLRAARKPK